MLKTVFALKKLAEEAILILSDEEVSDLLEGEKNREGEAKQKSSPHRCCCHCLICDSLEGGGGVTDISHPV